MKRKNEKDDEEKKKNEEEKMAIFKKILGLNFVINLKILHRFKPHNNPQNFLRFKPQNESQNFA